MSYRRTCLKTGHVLEDNISYRKMFFWMTYIMGRIYLTGQHSLKDNLCYWRTCITGLNIFSWV